MTWEKNDFKESEMIWWLKKITKGHRNVNSFEIEMMVF